MPPPSALTPEPCYYMYCPDDDVLYCNFCLKDEPQAKPAPKPNPEAEAPKGGSAAA